MSRNLRSLDLNLVPVLRALLSERSVTKAAKRIGLSQPATSNALGRMREILGDALLVKSGSTMVRTPLGEHLLPLLETACNELERVLHYEIWSPRTVKRNFTVVMTDHLVVSIARKLADILAEQAPSVTIRFGLIGSGIHARLLRGRIDIAYIGYSPIISKGLNATIARRHPLQAIVPSTHRFVKDPPATFAEFCAVPRIGLRLPDELVAEEQRDMLALMGSAHVPLEFSSAHLSALPSLAAAGGMMTVVPSPLAAIGCAVHGMTIVEIPECRLQYELCQYWSPRFNTDPGHRWLRGILDKLVEEAF